jgi:hypothetical protein
MVVALEDLDQRISNGSGRGVRLMDATEQNCGIIACDFVIMTLRRVSCLLKDPETIISFPRPIRAGFWATATCHGDFLALKKACFFRVM